MLKTFGTLYRAFKRDKRGATAVTFAIAAVPLIIASGAAIDFSNMIKYRGKMQTAADSAALTGASTTGNLSEVQTVAANAFIANFGTGATVTVTQPTDRPGVTRIVASYSVPMTFMKITGVQTKTVNVVAEATAFSGGVVEVALALDNTGSMYNDMGDLRTAATNLATQLFTSAGNNPNFRMSVVPYVAAVNPGKAIMSANSYEAMDYTASYYQNGEWFRWQWVSKQQSCTENWGSGGGGWVDPGTGTGDVHGAVETKPSSHFAYIFNELFGVKAAHALNETPAVGPPWTSGTTVKISNKNYFIPTGFGKTTGGGCNWLYNPPTVNVFDLFNRIPNATWKGCVEARPDPYDISEIAPSAAVSGSLYVPYFWPDEPATKDNGVPRYHNSYLSSKGTLPTGWDASRYNSDDWFQAHAIFQYNKGAGQSATIVETPPSTKGPNASCPDEVLPLTNTKSSVLSKISGLSYWNGGGTISSEGLMWAWRTLSPNKPYATAKPYAATTQKVIVLMTDGKNGLATNTAWGPHVSDYSAYGYLSQGRMKKLDGSGNAVQTFDEATLYLNDRMLKACAAIKAKGITIYTVLFRETDAATKSLLKSCATKTDYAYTAADGAALNSAFAGIARGISNLRLSK